MYQGFQLFHALSMVLLLVLGVPTSINALYIKGFRCFKALLFNYAIFIPKCQKVPIFKHFRHFSTHFNKFSIKISLFE